MSRRDKNDYITGLIKAVAVPVAVSVVLCVVLLYEIKPGLVMAALESIRGAFW